MHTAGSRLTRCGAAALLMAMTGWCAPQLFAQEADPNGEPAGAQTPSDPSDQVIDQLMRERPTPAVVQPRRAVVLESIPSRVGVPATRVDVDVAVLGVPPGDEVPVLRREGEFIVRQRGRLVQPKESLHTFIVFEKPEGDGESLPPMILQPSSYLETMQKVAEDRGGAVLFVVSGQVNTYLGMNYLLPTTFAPPVDLLPQPVAQGGGSEDSVPAERALDNETSAMLRELLSKRQAAPAISRAAPLHATGTAENPTAIGSSVLGTVVRGVAPGAEPVKLRNETPFIVDRRGRVVRSTDGAHVLFVFEADGRQSPEPPLILQASRMRESMERTVQQRGDGVVFIVSGQIQTYRGANYLMPTMMKIARAQRNADLR